MRLQSHYIYASQYASKEGFVCRHKLQRQAVCCQQRVMGSRSGRLIKLIGKQGKLLLLLLVNIQMRIKKTCSKIMSFLMTVKWRTDPVFGPGTVHRKAVALDKSTY